MMEGVRCGGILVCVALFFFAPVSVVLWLILFICFVLYTYREEQEDQIPWQRQRILETTGIPNVSKSSRYVVGVVQGGKLHLCSLKSIVQMRDVWPHLRNVEDPEPQGIQN